MHILLVDDHALFRAGLRLLLASLRPEVRFREAASIEAALAQARDHEDVRVCLLDLDLKQDSGTAGHRPDQAVRARCRRRDRLGGG